MEVQTIIIISGDGENKQSDVAGSEYVKYIRLYLEDDICH